MDVECGVMVKRIGKTVYKLDDDVIRWYELNGIDYGADVEFENETIGVSKTGAIVDFEGWPIAQGDTRDAVINSLRNANVKGKY